MAEMLIKGVGWFLIIGTILVAYAIPCLYVYRKGRLLWGFLLSLAFQCICYYLLWIALPNLLKFGFPDHTDLIDKNFPDGRIIAAVFGWHNSLILCGIASLLFYIKKRKPSEGSHLDPNPNDQIKLDK